MLCASRYDGIICIRVGHPFGSRVDALELFACRSAVVCIHTMPALYRTHPSFGVALAVCVLFCSMATTLCVVVCGSVPGIV